MRNMTREVCDFALERPPHVLFSIPARTGSATHRRNRSKAVCARGVIQPLHLFITLPKAYLPSRAGSPSPALHQQALGGVAGHMQQVEPVADVGGDVHHGRVGLSGGTEGGHGAAAEVGEADGHGAVEAD